MSMNRAMRALRTRCGRIRRDDSGISIIEVLVALLIFSLIAVGVGQATITAARLAADQKNRTVALNLAAGEIDRVRASTNPVTIPPRTQRSRDVGGITYTSTTQMRLVAQSGADLRCGVDDSDFLLARISVTVDWSTRLPANSAVFSTTLLAPSSRAESAETGTILIKATRADGSPYANLPLTVTQVTDGAPTTAPRTDEEGCSYALNVTPGTYRVTTFVPEHLNVDRQERPIEEIEVRAGEVVSASFDYDRWSRFTVTYAPGLGAINLASDLKTTYFNSNRIVHQTGTPRNPTFYPWDGYEVVAGNYIAPSEANDGCVSVDPAAWAAGPLAGLGLGLKAGVRQPAVSTPPGSTPSVSVPMGRVEVVMPNGGNYTITATNATTNVALTGDPGCEQTQTYTFGTTSSPFSGGSVVNLALPYGSWSFTARRTNNNNTSSVNARAMSNAATQPTRTAVVTLDPRRP